MEIPLSGTIEIAGIFGSKRAPDDSKQLLRFLGWFNLNSAGVRKAEEFVSKHDYVVTKHASVVNLVNLASTVLTQYCGPHGRAVVASRKTILMSLLMGYGFAPKALSMHDDSQIERAARAVALCKVWEFFVH